MAFRGIMLTSKTVLLNLCDHGDGQKRVGVVGWSSFFGTWQPPAAPCKSVKGTN